MQNLENINKIQTFCNKTFRFGKQNPTVSSSYTHSFDENLLAQYKITYMIIFPKIQPNFQTTHL